MASHNEYSLPREYRRFLADLFCKKGIADYTEQIRKLEEVCECSPSQARAIMTGRRDLSGQRTGNGLNKYAALAHYFSISVGEFIALNSEYEAIRGPRRKQQKRLNIVVQTLSQCLSMRCDRKIKRRDGTCKSRLDTPISSRSSVCVYTHTRIAGVN